MTDRVKTNTYDRHIIPAETKARMQREGDNYKKTPDLEPENIDDANLDTTTGYTVSREGLLNNYAVEPEMYYEVPGDLRHREEQERDRRIQELKDINQTDEDGKLTLQKDDRGKGAGIF